MAGMHRAPTRRVLAALAALLPAACLALGVGTGSAPSGTLRLANAPVGGCPVFPANNYWHADVRNLPVHPRSKAWLSHMSTAGRDLHPDFGPGPGIDYGIPVTVVDGSHPKVDVTFDEYGDESDHVPYPFGDDTRIEGGRDSGGDMHAVVVDRAACRLYETWKTTVGANGSWAAGSGATWDLRSNALRPDSWTSADAAGLPILPGLLRWAEVRNGTLDHAVRFTTDVTSRWYLWPARHHAGATDDRAYPPMGARFRLRGSFSTAGYGEHARVVIRAFKRYGLVLADNGSPWFFQGEEHAQWPAELIDELKAIPASAFVAVDTRPLRISADSARARRVTS